MLNEKIYIISANIIDDVEEFCEMTDEQVVAMCENAPLEAGERQYDVYETTGELAGAWNSEQIFTPSCSYMRIINI